MAEAGLGFGFLAVVISYLPVLYQAFSRREITISLLDARAGSPPTAGELLRRLAGGRSRARRRPPAGRVGALGGRAAGEPPVVPGAELLPLAARQPVVGGGADRDPRHLGPPHRRRGRAGRLPGAADVRDGPPRGGGPGAGFQTPPLPPGPTGCRRATAPAARSRCARRGWRCATGRRWRKALAELRGLYEPFVNALARTSCSRCRPSCRTSRRWTTGRPAPGCAARPASAACRRRGRPQRVTPAPSRCGVRRDAYPSSTTRLPCLHGARHDVKQRVRVRNLDRAMVVVPLRVAVHKLPPQVVPLVKQLAPRFVEPAGEPAPGDLVGVERIAPRAPLPRGRRPGRRRRRPGGPAKPGSARAAGDADTPGWPRTGPSGPATLHARGRPVPWRRDIEGGASRVSWERRRPLFTAPCPCPSLCRGRGAACRRPRSPPSRRPG